MKYIDVVYIAAAITILLFWALFIFKKGKKMFIFTVLLQALTAVFIGAIVLTGIEIILPESCKNSAEFISLVQIVCSALVAISLFKLYIEGREEQIDGVLKKIDSKYGDGNAYASLYFRHLFETSHSFEEEIVLRDMLNNHKKLSDDQIYLVSFDTYLNIVINFLKNGYSLISVNSTLIPYWYAPINFEVEDTKKYITSLQSYKKQVKRITYCEEGWWDNSVEKIFEDLADSEKEKIYAIQWLATLYRAIEEVPEEEIQTCIGLTAENNYPGFVFFGTENAAISKTATDENQWNKVKDHVKKESKTLTAKIIKKYTDTMGESSVSTCSTGVFKNYFKEIEEIGIFHKRKNYHPISILLLGNVSQAVKIKIVTNKDTNKQYQKKIDEMIKISLNS